MAISEIIKKTIGDFNAAKESLMSYLCQEKNVSFLDDLHMKKKLQEASVLAAKANVPMVRLKILQRMSVRDIENYKK